MSASPFGPLEWIRPDGARFRNGATVRYAGLRTWTPALGGMEGTIVTLKLHAGAVWILIEWAHHDRAAKAGRSPWLPTWELADNYKPIRKLSKGFNVIPPEWLPTAPPGGWPRVPSAAELAGS